MEPRKSEKPLESGGRRQAAPARPHKPKRRFQMIKLEERIAPSGGHGKTKGEGGSCECPTCG
jgi:hypothetical protein